MKDIIATISADLNFGERGWRAVWDSGSKTLALKLPYEWPGESNMAEAEKMFAKKLFNLGLYLQPQPGSFKTVKPSKIGIHTRYYKVLAFTSP